jgi:hypothetical protein
MTREEIVKAAEEDGFPKGEVADVIDFALAMVERHNEELAKIAEYAGCTDSGCYGHGDKREHGKRCPCGIADGIRAAKPK